VQKFTKYRIDKDPTSLPAKEATLWDYMPICQDTAQKSADGNIYKAYGGLRLKKFVDAFGTKGQVFSICNKDFTNAMVQIGNAIVQVLTPGCVVYPLIDTDSSTTITEPECQVLDRSPCSKGTEGCLQTGFKDTRLPECKDSNGKILDPSSLDPSKSSVDQVNTLLDNNISQDARPCWYLSYDNSPLGCKDTSYNGQRISALRKKDTVAPPGTFLAMQCLTCPNYDPSDPNSCK
jgi:hypothetical protein